MKLEMEYVELPTVDLYKRFLYRFKAPVETVWSEGKIPYLQLMEGAKLYNQMELFARQTWITGLKDINGDVLEIQPYLRIDEVTMSECSIVPKDKK